MEKKSMKGFWRETGWRLPIILGILCGILTWLAHRAGYAWLDKENIYLCLAIVGGSYAMLFLHYLAGTRPAPYPMYQPGVRDFDGTYK